MSIDALIQTYNPIEGRPDVGALAETWVLGASLQILTERCAVPPFGLQGAWAQEYPGYYRGHYRASKPAQRRKRAAERCSAKRHEFVGRLLGEIAKATGLLDIVRYWRTKSGSEVDFVVDRGDVRVGIEVKAGALRQPKLSRDARTFIELYRPTRFILVNAELHTDGEHAGVPVHYRPPWAFRETLLS